MREPLTAVGEAPHAGLSQVRQVGPVAPRSVVAEKKVHAEAVAAKENFKARGVEHAFSLRS